MTSSASAQAGEDRLWLERRQKWGEALEHITTALEILDGSEASAHVGARLDEAIHCLREDIKSAT